MIKFRDKDELKSAQEKFDQEIEKYPDAKKIRDEVESEVKFMNDELFNWDHEPRIRQAGLLPSQAEELAKLIKTKKVGQLFLFEKSLKVLTPFNTVVDGQVYVTALQDRVLELTTIPVEMEVHQLKQRLSVFTRATFLDLIVLAFKRLFRKG